MHECESCIRGQHVAILNYKDIWTPVVNKELSCRRKERIISD